MKKEIDNLKSIYLSDFQIISKQPSFQIKITVKPFIDANLKNEFINQIISLTFLLSENYPKEAPILKIENKINLMKP